MSVKSLRRQVTDLEVLHEVLDKFIDQLTHSRGPS